MKTCLISIVLTASTVCCGGLNPSKGSAADIVMVDEDTETKTAELPNSMDGDSEPLEIKHDTAKQTLPALAMLYNEMLPFLDVDDKTILSTKNLSNSNHVDPKRLTCIMANYACGALGGLFQSINWYGPANRVWGMISSGYEIENCSNSMYFQNVVNHNELIEYLKYGHELLSKNIKVAKQLTDCTVSHNSDDIDGDAFEIACPNVNDCQDITSQQNIKWHETVNNSIVSTIQLIESCSKNNLLMESLENSSEETIFILRNYMKIFTEKYCGEGTDLEKEWASEMFLDLLRELAKASHEEIPPDACED